MENPFSESEKQEFLKNVTSILNASDIMRLSDESHSVEYEFEAEIMVDWLWKNLPSKNQALFDLETALFGAFVLAFSPGVIPDHKDPIWKKVATEIGAICCTWRD